MEKVHPWCGQPSDRGRLGNRTFTYLHYFILLSNLLIIFAILFVGNEEGSMFDMTIRGYNQKHHRLPPFLLILSTDLHISSAEVSKK